MKLMKKIAVITAAAMFAMAISGCFYSGKKNEGDRFGGDISNMNLTGLPIAKEPVTLEAGIVRPSHIGAYAEMDFFKQLEEKTNVKIQWREFTGNTSEKINLMFASQDYPDFMLKGANDTQVRDAIAGSNIIPLDGLIEKYAPNWKQVLDSDSYVKKVVTALDGSVYTLPLVRQDPTFTGFRDALFINTQWLKTVGKEVPTTTEEFKGVLRAFKSAIDSGKLPKGSVPWYFRFNQTVGGHFDIFGSFGTLDSNQHIFVKDNKVYFTAITDEFKQTIQYLRSLYSEGLIPAEAFTDDWSAYISKIQSDPPVLGAFQAFNNPQIDKDYYTAMAPLKGPSGNAPIMRQQTNSVERNYFMIFTKNQYPEITMRWINELGNEKESIEIFNGMVGTHIEMNGNHYKLIEGKESTKTSAVPNNNVPAILTPERLSKITLQGESLLRSQYYDVYKQYVVPLDTMFPPVIYTEEQMDTLSQYTTDINKYINETTAKWIVDGGTENEWEAYKAKISELNLNEVLKIHQQALDSFNKAE